jgi:Acyl-coenzyme A:6-aminopenicillanic acid acyl-transferase
VTASGLRVVRVEGDAPTRGRRAGELLGDLVARSLDFYRDYLGDRSRELAPFRQAAERALPEHVAWLDAFAAGAEVSRDEVFAVNAVEELEQLAPVERCSTFTAVGDRFTLLGHNEMWLAGDADNVAVLVERPARGPAVASTGIACCLPAVGLNEHRLARGVDSLTARDDRVGVPRVLVSRHVLDARDRDDALRRAALEGRAGGYAYPFAAAGGEAFTIETTAERAAILDGPGVHTNHYLAPELEELGDERSASSESRLAHLRALVGERPPQTPEDAMAILGDHAAEPHGSESVVVCSLVCDVEAGRMWVAPGDPAETPYEEVDLDGVV